MLRYHQVIPQQQKDQYTEYDSVDFEMTFENRFLAPSSIRIEADLEVLADGSNLIATEKIYIDPKIGAHSFISTITTELQNGGVIENYQEVPRYMRMLADTTMANSDVMNSENTCELRTPNIKLSQAVLAGNKMNAGAATVVPPDFSIKPNFCLNTINAPLDYNKTGAIRVTIKLARNFAALYGPDVKAATSYQLKNLKLVYSSVDKSMAKANQKVSMRTKLNIKQTASSALSNISTKVPAVCRAVSCSFQKLSDENSMFYNNVETVVPPNIKELSFMFNDTQNEYITYLMKGREEVLARYIDSFADTGSNDISLELLEASKGYGIGLQFGTASAPSFIDLSNQKFNLQITSDIAEGYILYMFFHSVATV